jgi:hypothetical protein
LQQPNIYSLIYSLIFSGNKTMPIINETSS